MSAEYFGHERPELGEMVVREPRVALDLGCAAGLLGASVKARYPRARIWGVELDEAAAARAQTRLDRVFHANLESFDLHELRAVAGEVDLVFCADVLEHLVDPWSFLRALRPYLSTDAEVIASIPNVRNFNLVRDLLVHGRFRYEDAGLLDRTHVRFFTRESACELFESAGYAVDEIVRKDDGEVRLRVFPPWGGRVTVRSGRITVRGVDRADVRDLRTYQFLLRARPTRSC